MITHIHKNQWCLHQLILDNPDSVREKEKESLNLAIGKSGENAVRISKPWFQTYVRALDLAGSVLTLILLSFV